MCDALLSFEAQRIPFFIVGVTGHMDVAPDQVGLIVEQVRAALRFLHTPSLPVPSFLETCGVTAMERMQTQLPRDQAADLPLWRGLERTKILVLSSLAPGADSIVADVAKSEGCEVWCPLPFPADLYHRASTFVRCGMEGEDSGNTSRQREYARLLEKIGPSHTFPVLLKSDVGCSEHDLRLRFEAELRSPEARRRRYRAAGEYVAAYSHLLLAIWDGKGASGKPAGTGIIVHARRTQLSPELLPTTGQVSLSDAGPLLHIAACREGEDRTPSPCKHDMRFLYPHLSFGTKREGPVRSQFAMFCRNAANLEAFNQTEAPNETDAERELDKSMLYQEGECERRFKPALQAAAESYVGGLRQIVRQRLRASTVSKALQRRSKHTLVWLFLLTFLGASFLHLFAHWHPQSGSHEESSNHAAVTEDTPSHERATWNIVSPGDEHGPATDEGHVGAHKTEQSGEAAHHSTAQALFVVLAFLSGLAALVVYARGRVRRDGEEAHDYRSLAEGLRVQFYWNLAGLGRSVPANYMTRQRTELDWIRGVIRVLAMPYEQWKFNFDRLRPQDKITALKCVAHRWIAVQATYFKQQTRRYHETLHFWHRLGGGLSLSGIALFGVLAWGKEAWFHGIIVVLSAIIGAWLACRLLRFAVRKLVVRSARGASGHTKGDAEEESPWLVRLVGELVPTLDSHARDAATALRRLLVMAVNLACHVPLVVAIFTVVATLCNWLSSLSTSLPGVRDLMIICGGVLLVAGALGIAWAEKRLYSEFANQYSVMASLFEGSKGRIRHDIDKLEHQIDDPEAFTHTLNQTQDFLYALGREALEENAQWLCLHRARPLEPVMAG